MSHLCRLDGFLTLKLGVTKEQIESILSPIIENECLTFADAEEQKQLVVAPEGRTLDVAFEFNGQGGHGDPVAEAFQDALSPLVQGGQWLILVDTDSGDSQAVRVPYFLGDDDERREAQVHYGLALMNEWVEPLLGKGMCDSVKALLMHQVASVETQVPIKYWDAYGDAQEAPTHELVIDDRRRNSGQVFLDIEKVDGNYDDVMAVLLEVNSNPLNREEKVPCVHVHFNADELAFSLYKVGTKILVRPEVNVAMKQFTGKVDGSTEALCWINSLAS